MRGLRALGIPRALDTWRLNGSSEQILEGALVDLLNAYSHPVMGPFPRAALAGIGGVESSLTGMRDDRGTMQPQLYKALPKKTGGLAHTTLWRVAAAAKELNSFYHNLATAVGLFPTNPDEQGNNLLRTATDMAAPRLIAPAYNPYATQEKLYRQRTGMGPQ